MRERSPSTVVRGSDPLRPRPSLPGAGCWYLLAISAGVLVGQARHGEPTCAAKSSPTTEVVAAPDSPEGLSSDSASCGAADSRLSLHRRASRSKPGVAWIARPAPSFDTHGIPGTLTGPFFFPSASIGGKLRSARGGVLWLLDGTRLWQLPADDPESYRVSHDGDVPTSDGHVWSWCRISVYDSHTGRPIDATSVIADGTPLPVDQGRVPRLDVPVWVAARGYVPEQLPTVVRSDPLPSGHQTVETIEVEMIRSVKIRGCLSPLPSPRAKLSIDSSHGRRSLTIGSDGRFVADCTPAGHVELTLHDEEWSLSEVAFGFDARGPVLDLGVIRLLPRRRLLLTLDERISGTAWLRPGDDTHVPQESEYSFWPTIVGERLSSSVWAFPLVGHWKTVHGSLWTSDGWSGDLPLTVLGSSNNSVPFPVRVVPPRTLRVLLSRHSVGSAAESSLRLVAVPAWLGPATRSWLLEDAPALQIKRVVLAAFEHPFLLPGVACGRWSVAVLGHSGDVLARQVVAVHNAAADTIDVHIAVPRCGNVLFRRPRCHAVGAEARLIQLARSNGGELEQPLLLRWPGADLLVSDLRVGLWQASIRDSGQQNKTAVAFEVIPDVTTPVDLGCQDCGGPTELPSPVLGERLSPIYRDRMLPPQQKQKGKQSHDPSRLR